MSVNLKRNIDYIKGRVKPKHGKDINIQRGILAAELAAKIGIGQLTKIVTYSSEALQKQKIKISPDQNIAKLSGYSNAKNKIVVAKRIDNFDDGATIAASYGYQHLNNWILTMGKNNVIDQLAVELGVDLDMLFEIYANEVSLPTIDIATSNFDLGFTKNPDVSSIDYNSFSISFWLDEDMKMYKSILGVLDNMRSVTTGRYGYKSNYKWGDIGVTMLNGINNDIATVKMKNCIISGISDLTLSKESSDLKTITLNFEYDQIKMS